MQEPIRIAAEVDAQMLRHLAQLNALGQGQAGEPGTECLGLERRRDAEQLG